MIHDAEKFGIIESYSQKIQPLSVWFPAKIDW